jgi:hypothetical protein
MLRGTNDFLDGPDRWLAVDHMAELGRIRSLDGEKLQPFPKTSVPPRFQDFEGWARRFKSLVALALFSGHLVPRPLSRLGRRVVPVQSRSIAAPLGREELLYYWEPTSEGFVARRDRRRFFRLLRELDRTVRRAWKEFPEVAEQYRNRRGEFVSDEYWMRHFELDQLTLAQTPASADSKAVVN